jgi:hypothetical protein
VKFGPFQAETWKLAWQALIANKLRAALTMIGMAIGSCCIVLVVIVALSERNTSLARLKELDRATSKARRMVLPLVMHTLKKEAGKSSANFENYFFNLIARPLQSNCRSPVAENA